MLRQFKICIVGSQVSRWAIACLIVNEMKGFVSGPILKDAEAEKWSIDDLIVH